MAWLPCEICHQTEQATSAIHGVRRCVRCFDRAFREHGFRFGLGNGRYHDRMSGRRINRKPLLEDGGGAGCENAVRSWEEEQEA